MSEFKPNHICKNPSCRKHYYACNYCSRTLNWKSVACSFDCYQKYMDLVIEERSKGKKVDIKPERIDMTEKEVDELLERPIKEVIEETKEELKDFADVNGDVDFGKAVAEINKKINKKTTTRSKQKKNNEK